MVAAGARAQLEEMLPEMTDPNSFLLQNVYFRISVRFCQVFAWLLPGWVRQQQFGGCGHHQEGRQCGVQEELLWRRGSQHRLPGLGHEMRSCLLGSLYLMVLPTGCRPRPQHYVHAGADM